VADRVERPPVTGACGVNDASANGRAGPAPENLWIRAAAASSTRSPGLPAGSERSPSGAVARRAPVEAVDYAMVRRLRRRVVEALAGHLRIQPDLDGPARQELCRAALAEALTEATRERVRAGRRRWTGVEEHALAEAVMAELFGLGRLQALVDDPEVENIEVNGCDQVWVSYADGREVPGPPVADTDAELIEQLQLLAARVDASERSFTSMTPKLHTPLEDGSRLAAMAWTTPRPFVVIRRHRVRDVDLDGLVALGSLDTALAAFLRAALLAGKNIVVTGLQNAGKTTLIRALANEFGPMERFETIEREYELFLHELPDRHPRVVPMQAREGSTERDAAGRRAGEVTMEELVRDALRMTLRRIIVGEVRGSEVLPMLEAMSTGDGSLCTLHARSAVKAIDRIVTLCMSAGVGITDTFGYRLVADAVDLLVHIDLRDETAIGGRRHRYVSQVVELDGIGEAARPALTTVFEPGPDGRAVPAHTPSCLSDLILAGFDPAYLDARSGTWKHPLDTVRPPRGGSRQGSDRRDDSGNGNGWAGGRR
jgi:pilus assembly protein CpaF